MINSFMNREITSITIDCLIKKDQDGKIKLVTEGSEIRNMTAQHFQSIAGNVNVDKHIPIEWLLYYDPSSDIDNHIYDALLADIDEEEFIERLNSLPNKKATGPSGISYEILKHSSSLMKKVLRQLFQACIKFGDYPSGWKKADVYPIPKPKPFNCELINTRPITLLETTRKLFVSIMNQRVSKIIATHNVLKGYQFAGLPGKSTFEPIRIVNEIIEDAKINKNDIWLLCQDMSKAFNRVNISMLKEAMRYIQLPADFIKLITNLFLNRKNSVFTAKEKTHYYDIVVGID